MLTACRYLLYLYPPAHRKEFGEEMMTVLCERRTEARARGVVGRWILFSRELGGLFLGALEEQFRTVAGFHPWEILPSRRLKMKSEFRFPKATAVLMTVILAAVVMAIEKAKAIQVSVPYTTQPVGPIQAEQFTFLPTIGMLFAIGCAAGAVCWGVLFVLRRSGVHRLSELQVKK